MAATPSSSTAAAGLPTDSHSQLSTTERLISSSSHTHLDHVADLPTLAKARLLDWHEAFTVVGPQGTRDVCDALFAVDELADRLNLTVRELPKARTRSRSTRLRLSARRPTTRNPGTHIDLTNE